MIYPSVMSMSDQSRPWFGVFWFEILSLILRFDVDAWIATVKAICLNEQQSPTCKILRLWGVTVQRSQANVDCLAVQTVLYCISSEKKLFHQITKAMVEKFYGSHI